MNLTKKEIQEATTIQLIIRMNQLLSAAENAPDPKDISLIDTRETIAIETELQKRLTKAIGRSLYPPKPAIKKVQKIKFKVIVFSLLGSKAGEFNIEANSKLEADIKARKLIRKLGLNGAKYKLS